MSNAADRLAKDRTTREAALTAFNANLAQVRTDLEARGIGGRIADQASMEVRAGIDEALAIADDNKGIVAATIAALALWFLRIPLIAGLRSLLADGKAGDEKTDDETNLPEVQEPIIVSPGSTKRKGKEPTT